MEVIIKPNSAEVSKEAAKFFLHQIRRKPKSILGLATGSTPLGLYKELITLHETDGLDFSGVTTFNLDEYVGLGTNHPQSYAYYMQENLFSKINIPASHIHIPNGRATDVQSHCEEYEDKIRNAGGIDLQLLGLGSDGHIGFNEPSSSFGSRTRIKTLTERTISDNSVFFASKEEVPHHVITMGVGTIMDAHRCVILALGKKKADAVAATVEGPVTANVPASVLQFHARCTLIVDEEAAGALQRADYYRWVYNNKPEWQKL